MIFWLMQKAFYNFHKNLYNLWKSLLFSRVNKIYNINSLIYSLMYNIFRKIHLFFNFFNTGFFLIFF